MSIATEDKKSNGKVAPYLADIESAELKEPKAPPKLKQEKLQRVAIKDEEDDSSIAYCKLIVKHPWMSFGVALGAHLLMIIITGTLVAIGYDIMPIDFKDVPLSLEDDPTKLRTDAWWYAKDDKAVTTLTGGQQLRGVEYQMIQLMYEMKGGNVFTREKLLDIRKNEDEIFNNVDYRKNLCLLQGDTNRTCKPPLSILQFFDGSYKGIHPALNDPDFRNIPNVLHTAQSISVSKVILNYHLGKDAVITNTTASSQYTRSLVYIGWPYEGYRSNQDRDEEQAKDIDKAISNTFQSRLNDKYEDKIGDMNFYYDNAALNKAAIEKQVILDMMLAVASFIFIFLFMWLQTGSLWITSWGIFSIVSSFNITNLIYRVAFDYRYIGIFHVLSIFIILGIGSDNIFVFMDTWKQSGMDDHDSVAKRLSKVYKRAAKATLVTSFTTMMAFLSNVPSPLLAVSSFGLFSAILVLVNYLSVILFFPTVIIVHHVSRRGRCCCGPMCGKGRPDCNVPRQQSQLNLADQAQSSRKGSVEERIIAFFEGWFFDNVIKHEVVRWVVIAVFTVIIAVSILFATKLVPDEEQVAVWGSNTNWGRILNLRQNAFLPSQEDNVIVVHIIWGLKEQNRGACHHSNYKCKGKTVLDKSFDLNPPPCQNAMLKLCSKIKNFNASEEDKLKLRRNQVTGEIEINCFFERMNEYLMIESNKSKYTAGNEFDFPLNSVKMTELMKANAQFYNVSLLPDTYYRFFEVGVGYFITNGGDPNYANTYDFEKYSSFMAGTPDPTSKVASLMQGNKYGNRLAYVAIAVNTTLRPDTLGYSKGLPVYREWEDFVGREMNDMPSSCNSGFQATVSLLNEWHWLKVQEILVQNAFQGIAIGLCLALVVLIFATTNVIVGILATLIIGMITCAVLGIITMIGWKLGLLESLNLTLVVGLSVDYVVHLAEGYMELKHEDRLAKVRHTLGHVGISVTSGACTTLGASIFMFAAKIVFFFQFGIFIFCTIGLSILFSLILFTTTLALIGPEGESGSLIPVAEKVRSYMRGKTKHHVDCDTCKGKGFILQELAKESEETIQNTRV